MRAHRQTHTCHHWERQISVMRQMMSDSLVFITAGQILDVLLNQQVGLNTENVLVLIWVFSSFFEIICSGSCGTTVSSPSFLLSPSYGVSQPTTVCPLHLLRTDKHTHTPRSQQWNTHTRRPTNAHCLFPSPGASVCDHLKKVSMLDVDPSSGPAHAQCSVTSQA